VGLLDHQRTWQYRVSASPTACVDAFASAFEGGGLLVKGQWRVSRRGSSEAVADYQGRGGLVGALSFLSQTGQATETRAKGSQVTFKIEKHEGAHTTCAMWLSSRSTKIGFTDDAAVIRKHMQAVAKRLRQLDPSVQITTD
jgi:hypothetical protein